MSEVKSSISGVNSYQEIGEFWDSHDLGDFWEETEPVEFEVEIGSSSSYFPLEKNLALKLRKIAEQRGISAQTLLNLWVPEKITQDVSLK